MTIRKIDQLLLMLDEAFSCLFLMRLLEDAVDVADSDGFDPMVVKSSRWYLSEWQLRILSDLQEKIYCEKPDLTP